MTDLLKIRIAAGAFITVLFSFCLCVSAFCDESDKYLVVLKDNEEGIMALDDMEIEPVAPEINVYEADGQQVEALQRRGVLLEADISVPLTAYDGYSANDIFFEKQWYYDSLNFGELKSICGGGKGVRIAVIDTGANTDHEELKSANIVSGYDYYLSSEDYSDGFDHGTGVLGVMAAQPDNGTGIAGICPEAEFVVLKVMEGDGSSGSVALAKAIAAAVDDYDCDIINISLGTYTDMGLSFRRIVNYAAQKGAVIFASAGNDGRSSVNGTKLSYPAAYDNVIGVGSLTPTLERADHSQINESVVVSSPGESIYTLSNDGGYKIGSGTSYASPIAAGVFALLKSRFPDINYTSAMKAVKAGTFDLGELGYDTSFGYGAIDAMGLYDFLRGGSESFISPCNTNGTQVYKIKAYSSETEKGALVFEIFEGDRPVKISTVSSELKDDIISLEETAEVKEGQSIKIYFIKDFDSLDLLDEKEQ